jgi:hypothetical protein
LQKESSGALWRRPVSRVPDEADQIDQRLRKEAARQQKDQQE